MAWYGESYSIRVSWPHMAAETTWWIVRDGVAGVPATPIADDSAGWVTLSFTAEETAATILYGALVCGDDQQPFIMTPVRRPLVPSDLEALAEAVDGIVDASAYQVPPTAQELADAIWAYAERTLTNYPTLAEAVWAAVARTLTVKTGFSLTSDYDIAKAVGQQETADAIEAKVT